MSYSLSPQFTAIFFSCFIAIEICYSISPIFSPAFNQMGYRLSPQFAQLVVTRFDTQARRSLTLDNFIQACVMLKSITDGFRAKDAQMTGNIRVAYEEFLSMVILNKP